MHGGGRLDFVYLRALRQYDGGNPAFICFHDSDAFYISGGIIPAVFLPEAVTGFGKWMPAAFLMDAVKWMIKGGTALPVLKLVLMEGIVFALSAVLRRKEYDYG